MLLPLEPLKKWKDYNLNELAARNQFSQSATLHMIRQRSRPLSLISISPTPYCPRKKEAAKLWNIAPSILGSLRETREFGWGTQGLRRTLQYMRHTLSPTGVPIEEGPTPILGSEGESNLSHKASEDLNWFAERNWLAPALDYSINRTPSG